MQRALVVSVHDVAPATRPQIDQILAQLAELGVHRASLLVVADYHRAGLSFDQETFCDWTRNLAAAGHEVVIHGFYHQRSRRAGEGKIDKVITRFYTADEGEFYDLEYQRALKLIRRAQDEFARAGVAPCGFIAPAWLLGAEAEQATIDAGLRYTTTLTDVRDFTAGRRFKSQSIVYSVRTAWRRGLSLLWNRWLFRQLAANPLLRISIHPPDVQYPRIWRQIRRLVERAQGTRRPMTYDDWLAEQMTTAQ